MKEKKILYFDDEPLVRNMLGDMLEFLGYDSVGYSNPIIAFNSEPVVEDYHKIITDFNMPEMKGNQASEILIKIGYPADKIIGMSGLDYKEALSAFEKSGVKRVIGKPFIMEKIKEALES